MLEQATVIRETDAPRSPLVANADHGTQPQPAGNDSGVASELARILLGVRIVQTTTEQALQTGKPDDLTPASEGRTSGSPPSPLPAETMVVTTTGGAEEAGNQSLRPGPNTSGDAKTALLHAGEQGPETSPAEQVVRAARAQIGARHSQVDLQLEPPELGRVRISVRMNGSTIQMHVQTQTEQAHQLLNSRAAELRNTLQAQGLNLERVHIELRSPGQASSSHHQQDQSGTNNPMRDAQPDAHRGGQHQTEGEAEQPPAQNEPEHAFEATAELNDEPEESPAALVNLVA
ncbi:MAG: flagellar hook-length control protein FliK [Phycisphaerales bacterium]|nr:MAG: flagellar hook-length control protein FliK [Phycisphaerales bacterium]